MQNPFTDFQLIKSRNVAIRAGEHRLLFDPTRIPSKWRSRNTTICISHAHSDHTAGFKSRFPKIVTPETLEIYKTLIGKPTNVQIIQPGKHFELDDGGTIKFAPAGHMLGAAQFVVEGVGIQFWTSFRAA